MASEAQGAKARLWCKDGAGVPNWTTGTTPSFPFYGETMRKIASVVHPQVITGDRSEHGERARGGPSLYYGTITFGVSPAEMAFWAPYFMGTVASGTTFALSANALLPFAVLINKVTASFEFSSCYVDKALVVGKQGGPGGPPNFLTLQLTIYALAYQKDPSPPTTAISLADGSYFPLVFEDTVGAVTIKAAARETKQFAILINNFVKARYVNSVEPSILYPIHRQVSLQTRHPYDTGTSALDDVALSASAAGSIVATNGTVSVTWSFALLQLMSRSPVVGGKNEIDLLSLYNSRMTGSTKECTLTVDSTI